MSIIQYRPIGIIHTPYKTPQGTPIQPPASKGVEADVEVFEEYAEGLIDLGGFSHIYLIYHFHLSRKFSNAIGLSIVALIGTEKNTLRVKNIDVLDGTPLLDIKPYVPGFDICKVHKIGWMEKKIKNLDEAEDDGRFAE